MKKLKDENIKWLRDNGYITKDGRVEFSDRFIAILSNTTKAGNSLISPLRTAHTFGLIPKQTFPQVDSWDEYYDRNKITDAMLKLGREFLKRFSINFEKVYEKDFEQLLKTDLLNTAGYAWSSPINGIYPRVDNSPNHAFLTYKNKYFVFDNYEETKDDFVKRLAEDYNFMAYGYRLYITEQATPPLQQKINIMQQLLCRIKKKLNNILKLLEKKKPLPVEPEYKWGNRKEIESSITAIAKEFKVDPKLACKVAWCESRYNLKAVCQNKGSRDRGLYQWNNYFHPEITDEIAFNPEKSCRLFCKAVNNGHLSWWNASKKCWNV